MQSKDLLPILISALGFVVSVVTGVYSYYNRARKQEGETRKDISDVLSKIIDLNLESLKMQREFQHEPAYLMRVTNFLSQQIVMLLDRAALLSDTTDDLSSVELNTLAVTATNINDSLRADIFFQKSIAAAGKSPMFRSHAIRSYGDFLFRQGRFEAGRKQFTSVMEIPQDRGDVGRQLQGFTLQAWAVAELHCARSKTLAAPLFERAREMFDQLEDKQLRTQALNQFAMAKSLAETTTEGETSPNVPTRLDA